MKSFIYANQVNGIKIGELKKKEIFIDFIYKKGPAQNREGPFILFSCLILFQCVFDTKREC
jgi:hypothetical protein